jgi:hypothetical protein
MALAIGPTLQSRFLNQNMFKSSLKSTSKYCFSRSNHCLIARRPKRQLTTFRKSSILRSPIIEGTEEWKAGEGRVKNLESFQQTMKEAGFDLKKAAANVENKDGDEMFDKITSENVKNISNEYAFEILNNFFNNSLKIMNLLEILKQVCASFCFNLFFVFVFKGYIYTFLKL